MLICLAICLPAHAEQADTLAGARALIAQERYPQAVEMLEQTIKADADNYHAWFLLGVAHSRQRQFYQAIEAFHRVSELRPDLAEPHNNLAVIYNELGDVRAAVRQLEISLEKKPDYATAQENIADLHVKLALQYYKKALAQSPNEALARRYRRLLRVRDPGAPAPAMSTEEAEPAQPDDSTAPPPAPATLPPVPAPATAPEAAAVGEVRPEAVVQQEETRTDIDAVLDALEAWRTAWSARDMQGYIVAYADDFYPREKFASRDEWLRYKRRVIRGKKFIRVTLEHVQTRVLEPGRRVRVRFLQHFVSNSYNSDDNKELVIEWRNDAWKIVRETGW
ncbi:MAG: tetratricopeptide repeat protein [Mariprofundaceae bacterium]|nr:tetratricopeptide repeat protein [Mariprofundaceae bacterium]